MDVGQIKDLGRKLNRFLGEFDDCFGRSEPRADLRTYVRGQLSPMAARTDCQLICPRYGRTWSHALPFARRPQSWICMPSRRLRPGQATSLVAASKFPQ